MYGRVNFAYFCEGDDKIDDLSRFRVPEGVACMSAMYSLQSYNRKKERYRSKKQSMIGLAGLNEMLIVTLIN